MIQYRPSVLLFVLILGALLAAGCQRYTRDYAGVGEPEDAPAYTVKADPLK